MGFYGVYRVKHQLLNGQRLQPLGGKFSLSLVQKVNFQKKVERLKVCQDFFYLAFQLVTDKGLGEIQLYLIFSAAFPPNTFYSSRNDTKTFINF